MTDGRITDIEHFREKGDEFPFSLLFFRFFRLMRLFLYHLRVFRFIKLKKLKITH